MYSRDWLKRCSEDGLNFQWLVLHLAKRLYWAKYV
jgi:hypothetical protein